MPCRHTAPVTSTPLPRTVLETSPMTTDRGEWLNEDENFGMYLPQRKSNFTMANYEHHID